MFGQEKYKQNNAILNLKFLEKKVLIAQHRGGFGGNIPQNSLVAFKNSFLLGADMFEMDLIKSTDGKIYCFHDGTERENVGMETNILNYSSKFIDELELKNTINEKTGFKVQEFEEVIKYFNNGELYNIDRSWNYIEDVLRILNMYPNTVNQALLKGPVKRELLDVFEKEKVKYMFMPIVKTKEELDILFEYKNINIVGLECIVKTPEDYLFSDEFINEMHDKGLFLWINSINISIYKKHYLAGGFDDNKSIMEGFDKGWGVLIDKGFDIIQTDWPELLSKYLKQREIN